MPAYLLSTEGEDFTTCTLDLATQTYKKSPPSTPEHEVIGFEQLNLKEFVNQKIAMLSSNGNDVKSIGARWGDQLNERGKIFVLARFCAENHLENQARRLLVLAAKLPDRKTGQPVEMDQLQAVIKADIGNMMMWRTVLKHGDPKVSRTELLNDFQQFEKLFPSSTHLDRVRDTIRILQQMVQEDANYAQRNQLDTAQMTTEERVADFIFQLRNQNGRQYGQPGACDIFNFDMQLSSNGTPEIPTSPAHQLVAIGYDAVPQLIASLDDERLTRSVGYHRNFYYSHYVLRVGDCCYRILQRIAARNFKSHQCWEWMGERHQTQLATSNAATRLEIEGWWAKHQSKGEKQMLIEGTARGDKNSSRQAHRLVEKYPDEALQPIIEGTRNSEEGWDRANLVGWATRIPGTAATEFLETEMIGGSTLSTRLRAARGLTKREAGERAIVAMIGEWERIPISLSEADLSFREELAHRDLINFLASHGQAEAILALSNDFRERSVYLRATVINAIHRALANRSKDLPQMSADTTKLSERLLINALDDDEIMPGNTNRVCDSAADALDSKWPDKYAFDINASQEIRDKQRQEAKNIWYGEQKAESEPE